MRTCIRCSCSDGHACIEFDAEGYAHACYWFSTDLCSACAFNDYIEPPGFDDGEETRLLVSPYRGRARITPAQYDRQFLRVRELAGMVARPRTSGPQPRKRR